MAHLFAVQLSKYSFYMASKCSKMGTNFQAFLWEGVYSSHPNPLAYRARFSCHPYHILYTFVPPTLKPKMTPLMYSQRQNSARLPCPSIISEIQIRVWEAVNTGEEYRLQMLWCDVGLREWWRIYKERPVRSTVPFCETFDRVQENTQRVCYIIPKDTAS